MVKEEYIISPEERHEFVVCLKKQGLPHEKITFLFTDEENTAIREETEMTQELYNSIVVKCIKAGPDAFRVYLQIMENDNYVEFKARFA